MRVILFLGEVSGRVLFMEPYKTMMIKREINMPSNTPGGFRKTNFFTSENINHNLPQKSIVFSGGLLFNDHARYPWDCDAGFKGLSKTWVERLVFFLMFFQG
jgi:hypothetical protein